MELLIGFQDVVRPKKR